MKLKANKQLPIRCIFKDVLITHTKRFYSEEENVNNNLMYCTAPDNMCSM